MHKNIAINEKMINHTISLSESAFTNNAICIKQISFVVLIYHKSCKAKHYNIFFVGKFVSVYSNGEMMSVSVHTHGVMISVSVHTHGAMISVSVYTNEVFTLTVTYTI